MTPTEALLAMKIGCKITPVAWLEQDAYYYIDGGTVVYHHIPMDIKHKVIDIDDFIDHYNNMEWRLYDNSTSSTGNEDRMQNQS